MLKAWVNRMKYFSPLIKHAILTCSSFADKFLNNLLCQMLSNILNLDHNLSKCPG